MTWRSVPFVKEAVLFAAGFLLTAPQVLAGDRVHASSRPTTQAQPAPIPLVRAVAYAVVVTTVAQPAPEPLYVNLRGPNGQVRRFPVEGGREAIRYQPPVVLRPGQSVTIQWVAAK